MFIIVVFWIFVVVVVVVFVITLRPFFSETTLLIKIKLFRIVIIQIVFQDDTRVVMIVSHKGKFTHCSFFKNKVQMVAELTDLMFSHIRAHLAKGIYDNGICWKMWAYCANLSKISY